MRNHKFVNSQANLELSSTTPPDTKKVIETNTQADIILPSTKSNNPPNYKTSNDYKNQQVASKYTHLNEHQNVENTKIESNNKNKSQIKFTAHQSFIDPESEKSKENNEEREKNRKTIPSYDFANKANPENSLETFSEQKKEQIKGKILKNKFSQNNSALIILVIVIICLTGLCAFTTYQIYKYEKLTTATQKSQQIAINLHTWSGSNFETSFNSNLNDQFQKETKEIDFDFLDNKKGQVNSFLSRDEIDGENYNTGIIIYSTEFDNKLGQEEFTQKVLSKTNSEYLLTDQKIAFSGDTIAYKLANKNKKSYTNLYPVVTAKNYYVVKVINPGQELPQLNQKNKIVEELLSQLKLK